MKQPQGIVAVTGRVLLSVIFLMAAVGNKIPHFSDVDQLMAGRGIPQPKLTLTGAIVFLLAGSLSVRHFDSTSLGRFDWPRNVAVPRRPVGDETAVAHGPATIGV